MEKSSQYRTLDEIRLRKEQISDALGRDADQMGALWASLFEQEKDLSRGQQIARLITHSITAIDAFLMMRKLMRHYDGLLHLFPFKRKKR